MKTNLKMTKTLSLGLLAAGIGLFTACNEDPEPEMPFTPGMETFDYGFNEGQLLNNPATAYNGDGAGDHPRNLSAKLEIKEMENGNAEVTIRLENGLDGMQYPVHVHDAADPSTTPNGTPYNETPNGDIFAGMISVSNGMGSQTMQTEMNYDMLLDTYDGFLVVHDPTQAISTTDLGTYLVLGVFGQELPEAEANLRTETFMYDFNEGQLLDNTDLAYDGDHARNLMAEIMVEEMIDGTSKIRISLMNAMEGMTYMVHAHDAADPSTTPNGTPYNETPNGDIFAGGIEGNGGTVMAENELAISFNELTRNYEGFLVVHDPTQAISTTDLTTYLVVGAFAR
ncbi:hypothetical protein SAMN05192553_11120 [Cyclobacterium xiamenense]|uniref:CHRD domain-containing protein n=2 Tax=Cyclobacterium xiamenense TaxID=1297121 RepID=A0A1H7BK49_9BACT|nr:hypothetical protein SAMN05192553_11120 [Cyclobacterium xiamenense]